MASETIKSRALIKKNNLQNLSYECWLYNFVMQHVEHNDQTTVLHLLGTVRCVRHILCRQRSGR